jgi:hypothetical protein
MIARENEHKVGVALFDKTEVLLDGICRTGIPV